MFSDEDLKKFGNIPLTESMSFEKFMSHDSLAIKLNLTRLLKEQCLTAPFSSELLNSHWCYTDYCTLLRLNDITIVNGLKLESQIQEGLDLTHSSLYGNSLEKSQAKNALINTYFTKDNLTAMAKELLVWGHKISKLILKGEVN